MPGPSTRDLKRTKQPHAASLHPDEEEQRRERELGSQADEHRTDEHVESDEEQQARDSEKAFDQAITRIPPG